MGNVVGARTLGFLRGDVELDLYRNNRILRFESPVLTRFKWLRGSLLRAMEDSVRDDIWLFEHRIMMLSYYNFRIREFESD